MADRLVRAENVRAALTFVSREEVPLGIVYETDAKIEPKVRIVDVETSQTKWPSVSDGQPFAATTDYTRKEARDTPLAVRNMMLEDLSGAISRLFYDFKPNSEGGRGEPD